MKHPLNQAVFVTSTAAPEKLPPATGEVAFAGRSNAGKSSALNALTRRHNLARVSRTPGRTQTINFFHIGGRPDLFLADLPGYGYAKVPQTMRRQWAGLIENYLSRRKTLRGLILLMDIRHPFTDLDCQLLDWYQPAADRPLHILLTKADKLSRSQASLVLAQARKALADRPGCSVQLFSCPARTGVDEAELMVMKWLGIAEEPAPAATAGPEPAGRPDHA